MKSTNGVRFALYCRVSTQDQADTGESLNTQKARLHSIVSSLGGVVVRVVALPEHATPGHDRAAFIGLLNEAVRGQFDALIVNDSSRFARDMEVALFARQRLKKAKVRLFFGSTEQDLFSPSGEAMASMAAVFDQLQTDTLRIRAADSRLERAKRGYPHSNSVPFGRRLASGTGSRKDATAVWELDPRKAGTVAEMYDLYVNREHTLADVGRRVGMNAETVRRILVKQSGPAWRCKFRNHQIDEYEEVVIKVPRLLTDEQIERVRRRAAQNQVERQNWVRQREYVLSGWVRCANDSCDCSNLSGHQSKGNPKRDARTKASSARSPKAYAYYTHRSETRLPSCLPLVPAEALEASVIGQLSRLLNNPSFLREAIAAARPKDAESHEALICELEEIERQLRQANQVIERGAQALLEGEPSAFSEKIKLKVREADQKIQLLNRNALNLRQRIAAAGAIEPALVDEILHQFANLNGSAALLWPPALQRQLLALFFGTRSTRHMRDSVGVRSTTIGIFVEKCIDKESGSPYYSYRARGLLGLSLTGHIAELEFLDRKLKDHSELLHEPRPEDVEPIVQGLHALKGTPWFRQSRHAGRPTFARACRGTSLRA